MNYCIENNSLRVEISDIGAELQSVYGKITNFEYLWQGNPKYWSGRAYNLFPICGRLMENKYFFNGQEYQMGIHGFAKNMFFTVIYQDEKSIVFELNANKQTLSVYPFDFCLRVKYTLVNEKLKHEVQVENKSKENLFFSFGVHYGFNIPLCDSAKFDEHYIDFVEEHNLSRELCATNGLRTNVEVQYNLEENRYLKLSHELFKTDSIFLKNMGSVVILKCEKTKRYIKICYKDMKHLVLWHTHNTEAPFVCIEPWHGSPSFDGVIDDLTTKKDSIKLETDKTYNSIIELAFNE